MSTAQVAISDWQALYKTTYNAVYIGEVCQTLPQEIVIFNKVWAECVCVCACVRACVRACVHVCVCELPSSPYHLSTQISSSFTEELHQIAGLINRIVSAER